MKLIELVDFRKIIFKFYEKDIKNFITSPDFEVSQEQKEELEAIAKTEDSKTLLEGLDNFFNKYQESSSMDFNLMLTLLLQRYHYFNNAVIQWIGYCNDIKEDISITDSGMIFMDYISEFFAAQIDYFNKDYLKSIQDFDVESWNKKFVEELKRILIEMTYNPDFTKKLEATEKMVHFIQDTKNIYSSLEGVGIEAHKSVFLSQTNELKIIFQSMNNLINEILKALVSN
ncbi:hypothetical protein [Spiroplasma taiwanense]|uniref:Uncharacterized protein n=1 Tax=Spiroplasma taiwanense CT-1 TaxID=1276220 RepID=S5MHC8_9MOLU|nr:hypothetical protein [Spiroplasma taiwanense]AGR41250.1 hypothetical protein STAIW_v1c06310 [Spiroplasma taiwanense CT-1]